MTYHFIGGPWDGQVREADASSMPLVMTTAIMDEATAVHSVQDSVLVGARTQEHRYIKRWVVHSQLNGSVRIPVMVIDWMPESDWLPRANRILHVAQLAYMETRINLGLTTPSEVSEFFECNHVTLCHNSIGKVGANQVTPAINFQPSTPVLSRAAERQQVSIIAGTFGIPIELTRDNIMEFRGSAAEATASMNALQKEMNKFQAALSMEMCVKVLKTLQKAAGATETPPVVVVDPPPIEPVRRRRKLRLGDD